MDNTIRAMNDYTANLPEKQRLKENWWEKEEKKKVMNMMQESPMHKKKANYAYANSLIIKNNKK